MSELTEENCITALCIFEAFTEETDPHVHARGELGIFWLRQQCVDLCKQVDEVWEIAVELSGGVEFPVAFDWEFVPELVNHHLHFVDSLSHSPMLGLNDSPRNVATKVFEKWEKEGKLG